MSKGFDSQLAQKRRGEPIGDRIQLGPYIALLLTIIL